MSSKPAVLVVGEVAKESGGSASGLGRIGGSQSIVIHDCDTSESLSPSVHHQFKSMNKANCNQLQRQILNLSLKHCISK